MQLVLKLLLHLLTKFIEDHRLIDALQAAHFGASPNSPLSLPSHRLATDLIGPTPISSAEPQPTQIWMHEVSPEETQHFSGQDSRPTSVAQETEEVPCVFCGTGHCG